MLAFLARKECATSFNLWRDLTLSKSELRKDIAYSSDEVFMVEAAMLAIKYKDKYQSGPKKINYLSTTYWLGPQWKIG